MVAVSIMDVPLRTRPKLRPSARSRPACRRANSRCRRFRPATLGYRYYNPSTGHWLSRDPIEEKGGGANLYHFVYNNPYSFFDDTGLKPKPAISFDEIDKIAIRALEEAYFYMENSEGRIEYGGRICKCCKDGKTAYTYTIAKGLTWKERLATQRELRIKYRNPHLQVVGTVDESKMPECPKGCEQVAYYHTHPRNRWHSDPDKDRATFKMLRSYVGSGNGPFLNHVSEYDPGDDSDTAKEVELEYGN